MDKSVFLKIERCKRMDLIISKKTLECYVLGQLKLPTFFFQLCYNYDSVDVGLVVKCFFDANKRNLYMYCQKIFSEFEFWFFLFHKLCLNSYKLSI